MFPGFNPQDLIYNSMKEQGAHRSRKAGYENAMQAANERMQNALNSQRGQLSGMFDSGKPPQGAQDEQLFNYSGGGDRKGFLGLGGRNPTWNSTYNPLTGETRTTTEGYGTTISRPQYRSDGFIQRVSEPMPESMTTFGDYQKSRGAYNTDEFKNFLEQLRLR